MSKTKIINLVNFPKKICKPLKFPLLPQDLQDINNLKQAFRNSFQEHQVYSLGMAAPQIGVFKRLFIMPKSYHYGRITNFAKLKHIIKQFNVYINPVYLKKSIEKCYMDEYCLSIGQNQYKISRPKDIQVQYYNLEGMLKKQKLTDIRSRVFQHQYDHLQGILMSQIEGAKKSKTHKPKEKSSQNANKQKQSQKII